MHAISRLAVVTGAASGIGRETTRLLLERGCRVVAADIDEAGLRALQQVSPAVRCVTVDVADLLRGPAERPASRAARSRISETTRA